MAIIEGWGYVTEGEGICAMGIEFQACIMESPGDLFHNNVNLLNTTELHTSQWLRRQIVSSVCVDGEHMYTCGGFISIFGKTNTIL